MLVGLASCTIKAPVRTSEVAFPESKRLGISVGYFLAPEAKSFEHRTLDFGGNELVLPIGATSATVFDAMFSKLFAKSRALTVRPSETSPALDADAVIEPRLEGASIEGPGAVGWAGQWRVALQYLFLFSDNAGHPIAYWHVAGDGQSKGGIDWTGFAGSEHAGEALGNAFRDLQQRFLDGFAKVPEIRSWLEARGVSAG
jgi:hypothetical protein